MTADSNPYAALEALEVKARHSRKHEAKHKVDAARTLVVMQDGAVREQNYRGGAVFEFWYDLQTKNGANRYITRVEAQDLLDGYEPEPPAPFDEAAFIARAEAVPTTLEHALALHPLKYTTPAPVTVNINDSSHTAKADARTQALERLGLIGVDAAWWDARPRFVGEAWLVSFERRTRRRE